MGSKKRINKVYQVMNHYLCISTNLSKMKIRQKKMFRVVKLPVVKNIKVPFIHSAILLTIALQLFFASTCLGQFHFNPIIEKIFMKSFQRPMHFHAWFPILQPV